jgi:hypothetical protein
LPTWPAAKFKRRRLLELLKRKEPIWKDKDHPELKGGAAAWVREMRAQSEARFQKIGRRRKTG